jgi:hypothetical protein
MAKKSSNSLNGKVSLSIKQALLVALLFGVMGAVAVLQSFAAPPIGKGKGGGKVVNSPNGLSYSIVSDQNSDGQPNWGDTIRFSIDQTATTEPHVDVSCTQNGEVVYTAQSGYFDSYPWPWTQNFELKSGAWTGSAADCTAKWYYFNGPKTVTGGILLFQAGA